VRLATDPISADASMSIAPSCGLEVHHAF
jgi:hypothetical protein